MKVILPGSYDPITLGHLEIIKRAASEYPEVYVVIFINPDKKYFFSEAERLEMLRAATADIRGVTVDFSSGLVIDYMREKGIERIIKGYRNEIDLESERGQAEYNLSRGGYATELYKSSPDFENISSTRARERIISGGELFGILPEAVIRIIKKRK